MLKSARVNKMDRHDDPRINEQADSPADLPARARKEIALATWRESGRHDLGLVSAGIAFYAFLVFVPLLTAFVLGYGLLAEPASVVQHMQSLTSMMPQKAAKGAGSIMIELKAPR